jgi:GntR family transcriptional regulator
MEGTRYFMGIFMNKSQRLHESLGRLIAETQPGERLPSEPELARQLQVSRATLREAMRTFETQGMIHRRQGSGTFVSHPSQVIDSGLEVLESIDALAKGLGLQVSMGEYIVDHRKATEAEANALGISLEDDVVHVSRVILAEGRPVAYLIDILPDDVLSTEDLSSEFTGSVIDLLLKRGKPQLTSSRCEINAVTADAHVSRAMRIQRGDVLLRFVAYLYTTSGQVVDFSYSYFLPGYFRFHVNRRVEMVHS